jgi:hypothetical protein
MDFIELEVKSRYKLLFEEASITFHRFLKEHERLLSAVGTGLVLLTLVVREAIREDLRDLIFSIESAHRTTELILSGRRR